MEQAQTGTTDPTLMFFDQYQRYHTAAELIRMIRRTVGENRPAAPLRILEAGANEHRDLGKELPDADIYYTDLHLPPSMKDDDHCFTADATDLQGVGDASYDVCLALDVLEHIPREKRGSFFTELYRVCRHAVVLCFPYNRPEVVNAETEVNEMYRELFREEHPWLKEHIACGLPAREDAEALLRNEGIAFLTFTHGSLAVWKRLIVLNFFIDEPAFSLPVSEANLYYNRHLYAVDTSDADYRTFYVLFKNPALQNAARSPFEGKQIGTADLSPIDRVLEML